MTMDNISDDTSGETRDDDGPAPPPSHDPKTHPSGMTLRDYFAAQAMAASWMPQMLVETQARAADMTRGQRVAAIAYLIADRMLQEREQ